MKTIGLIGGMSWLSTVDYYRAINQDVGARLGGMNNARIVMVAINVADAFACLDKGDRQGVERILTDAAGRIEGAGADLLALCSNSSHIFADAVAGSVDIPLVNLIDAVASHVAKAGIRKIGVLATKNLVDSGLYTTSLAGHGIETVVPDDDRQALLEAEIEAGVTAGRFGPQAHVFVGGLMRELVGQGADSMLLGCTEIPQMAGEAPAGLPLVDTTLIHAAAIVEKAFER